MPRRKRLDKRPISEVVELFEAIDTHPPLAVQNVGGTLITGSNQPLKGTNHVTAD